MTPRSNLNAFVRGRPYWWQWPTILSLDAPAVALVWQWLLARVVHATLAWPHAFILGSSVWLAYAADRWIEGWRLADEQLRTQRHAFYKRARWPVAFIWSICLGADVVAAVTHLNGRELGCGLVLLAAVLMYLLSHQTIHRRHPWRVPKEACVAALFGGGVALFLVAQSHEMVRPLAFPLVLFMLLCLTNCALISTWERDIDETQGQTSLALQFERGAVLIRALPWILAALAPLIIVTRSDAARTVAICVLASTCLLGIVNALERRIGRQLARVLADVVLMTPCLPLVVAWLR